MKRGGGHFLARGSLIGRACKPQENTAFIRMRSLTNDVHVRGGERCSEEGGRGQPSSIRAQPRPSSTLVTIVGGDSPRLFGALTHRRRRRNCRPAGVNLPQETPQPRVASRRCNAHLNRPPVRHRRGVFLLDHLLSTVEGCFPRLSCRRRRRRSQAPICAVFVLSLPTAANSVISLSSAGRFRRVPPLGKQCRLSPSSAALPVPSVAVVGVVGGGLTTTVAFGFRAYLRTAVAAAVPVNAAIVPDKARCFAGSLWGLVDATRGRSCCGGGRGGGSSTITTTSSGHIHSIVASPASAAVAPASVVV